MNLTYQDGMLVREGQIWNYPDEDVKDPYVIVMHEGALRAKQIRNGFLFNNLNLASALNGMYLESDPNPRTQPETIHVYYREGMGVEVGQVWVETSLAEPGGTKYVIESLYPFAARSQTSEFRFLGKDDLLKGCYLDTPQPAAPPPVPVPVGTGTSNSFLAQRLKVYQLMASHVVEALPYLSPPNQVRLLDIISCGAEAIDMDETAAAIITVQSELYNLREKKKGSK